MSASMGLPPTAENGARTEAEWRGFLKQWRKNLEGREGARLEELEADMAAIREVTDPAAQLQQRLGELGGGPGYSAVAGAVFGAVRATGGAELQSLVYTPEGMQITVAAPGTAELQAFEAQLAEAGAVVTPGAVRDAGGRQIGEYRVSAR